MNLDVIEQARPCVGSGMYCKSAPCGFGKWDEVKKQCAFLEVKEKVDGVEIYQCGKFDEIQRDPTSRSSPAFGAGCCQPLFNANRKLILRLIGKGRINQPHAFNPEPPV